MNRSILASLVAASLSGCASQEVVKKSAEYGVTHEIVKTEYGEFRVYEHPTKKTIAVSATLGGAAAQGFVKGMTFGVGNILPSEGGYHQAAQEYLDKHPEAFKACKVTSGYLLQEPVYEFTYDCIAR